MKAKRSSNVSRSRKLPSRPAAKRKQTTVTLVHAPRLGEKCPQCKKGRLDYDGLLNLSCPVCGYSAGGGACT